MGNALQIVDLVAELNCGNCVCVCPLARTLGTLRSCMLQARLFIYCFGLVFASLAVSLVV